jgi:hypothetical protein
MQLPSPGPDPEEKVSRLQKKDQDASSSTPAGSSGISLDKVMENIMEGQTGQRGEIYVAIQFLLIFLVIIGPVVEDTLIDLGLAFGLALCAVGLTIGAAAVVTLGDSLTPWPKPVKNNQFKSDGVFGLCRHPIYGGALYTCAGKYIFLRDIARYCIMHLGQQGHTVLLIK